MSGHRSDFIRIFIKLRLQVWLKKYLALRLQLKREEQWRIKAVFLWVCAANWRLLWQQAWRGHDKHVADLRTSNTTFQLGLQRQRINHVTALWPATQIWPHKSQPSWRDGRLTFDLYPAAGSGKEKTHKWKDWSVNGVKMRDFQVTCSVSSLFHHLLNVSIISK